ncbi:uncharacterized protein DNG_07071 [Cephalotrichum gorgonifer]|uniref:Uncharacterized protein n=1 Tax=Cephalotrichum gorgonifer TaxID=2041049 RepID=A0AAE8N0V3_9PEZI|nr:uncharacterized protein DNG_07071 [Cephalotrichum gorgonifer]
MGYTHYYQVIQWDSPAWQAAWPLLVRDTRRIIDSAGIPVTGEDGPIISSTEDSICFNGVDGDGHEPFCMDEENNRSFAFTKTARKPYDLVVCCVLLRAHMLAPKCLDIRSDGYWSE